MADKIEYCIETATDSLNDLQLYVIPLSNSGAGAQPRWIRRRVLGSKEVVDELLDVQTARICWTAHRPLEGWYLYLRSPLLPKEAKVQLKQPSRRSFEREAGSRPLSLQVVTRANPDALQSSAGNHTKHARSVSNPFTSINLEQASADVTDGQLPSRSTGVTESKTHARRRSSGVSSNKDSQHVSRRSASDVASTPIITESNAEESSEASTACTIVMSDGKANVPNSTQPTSWARRAWKAIPTFVRPELNFDASNSFSVWWTDVDRSEARSIEVARFVDEESAGWGWNSKRKGVLSFHRDALLALNVDAAMWVALSLAYLEYLNERKVSIFRLIPLLLLLNQFHRALTLRTTLDLPHRLRIPYSIRKSHLCNFIFHSLR